MRAARLAYALPLAVAAAPLLAQSTAPENPAPAARVEISASAVASRRGASAAKVIVTRDDLVRFGDNNLADALQRIPGISIDRSPGKDAVVRMRGLGAGYTQVLINGAAVPPGFSIDAISPAQVERVEVLRSATADVSAQAIAGTLNIILKAAASKRQRELKAGIGGFEGAAAPMLSGDFADHNGTLSYGLAGGARVERERWPALALTDSLPRNGQPSSLYRTVSNEKQRETTINLSPRASWKPGEGQMLSVDAMLQRRARDYAAPDTRTALSGDAPAFAGDLLVTAEKATQALANAQWKSPLGERGRIESKLTLTLLKRRADSRFDASDEQGGPVLHRTIASDLNDRSLALRGKVAFGLSGQHGLDLGWDGQSGRRVEDRVQAETSPVGLPLDNLAEDYRATISRLAVFVQDGWTISSALSAYLGVRYEILTARTGGNVLAAVNSRSSVASPTAQLLWKVPGTESDQVRIALGRTFKAPTARELIPRRWVVNQNSATTPNFQGNPDLLPELAWGLDLGYEHYLPGDAFLGVNGYARSISRVVLAKIFQSGATWIETPVNNGNAKVFGLELEAKGKLGQWLDAAPNVDLRLGMARNWSRLDSVPGPGNRLNRQPALTASLGADWHAVSLPLTVGTNFVFEKGGFVRIMPNQSTDKSDTRLLDMYALWKCSRTASLRFTAANLLADDEAVRSRYSDDSVDEAMNLRTATFRRLKLVFETKF